MSFLVIRSSTVKPRVVAIIPARGGSKGIPRKNIVELSGKPLVAHTIEYALKSRAIDEIFVSTDDMEIASISEEYGTQVIDRPSSISGDRATTESAIAHALESIKENPDIVVLLQPTSPLRPEGSLDQAIKKFIDGSYDSLLSISPTHRFMWSISNDIATPGYDYLNRKRRQDILLDDTQFIENGSLYVFTRSHFNLSSNRLGGKIGYIVFDEKYSYEIDSSYDLELIKILMDK